MKKLSNINTSKFNLCQGYALPHEKCYRKALMPQIENVTQIKLRTPEGGRPNGVKHERKKGSNEGIQTPLSKGNEKREEGPAG